MLRKLRAQQFAYSRKAIRAVSKASLYVLREAQLLTPVDLGNLRASGFVVVTGVGASHSRFTFENDPTRESHRDIAQRVAASTKETLDICIGMAASNRRGVVGFVAFGAYYALFVHENLTAHHDVGQAKFLETVLTSRRNEILKIVADELRKVW